MNQTHNMENSSTLEEVVHKELDEVAGINTANEDRINAIRKKIDIRLLPVLTLLYLMSVLDRGNSTFQKGGEKIWC